MAHTKSLKGKGARQQGVASLKKEAVRARIEEMGIDVTSAEQAR